MMSPEERKLRFEVQFGVTCLLHVEPDLDRMNLAHIGTAILKAERFSFKDAEEWIRVYYKVMGGKLDKVV